jgi:hypothetical protein
MPFHSLELLPDQSGQQVIRADWRVLSEAGLRSQLEHRGATNAPHLTLVATAVIDPLVEALAAELIAPLGTAQWQGSRLVRRDGAGSLAR